MKSIFTIVTISLLAFQSFAVELNYKWKANSAYTYGATITDNISTSMMGMNIQEKYLTTVDFVLAISKENPTEYFKAKGFETIISYNKMILK